MTRKRVRPSVARYFTPPVELCQSNGYAKTPQRSAVLAIKLLVQELKIQVPQEVVQEVTGVAPRVQTRILASKQPRTRHNQPDSGPDPRGQKRAITRSETAAIAAYTDDASVPLDDRGAPWLDLAEASGVQLPQTYHHKPPGYRTIEPQSVQKACRQDEDMTNAICEEEKELTDDQAIVRTDWIDIQLPIRPHSDD